MDRKFIKRVTLFSGSAVTASTTGNGTVTTAIVDVSNYRFADLLLKTGTGTGTSPTLNVYVQKRLADDTTWTDIVSFTQQTTTALTKNASVTQSVAIADYTVTDASLAAGSIKACPMGAIWRVKIVIAGTNPSYATISLWADLFE